MSFSDDFDEVASGRDNGHFLTAGRSVIGGFLVLLGGTVAKISFQSAGGEGKGSRSSVDSGCGDRR